MRSTRTHLNSATSRTLSRKSPPSFLGLFTVESWREFKSNGGSVMGFTDKKWATASRLKPGDRILCYLTKVSAFVGVLKVIGPAYRDPTQIWTDGVFPVRIPVTIELERPLSDAVPIRSLKQELSIFKGKTAAGWTAHVRSSPRLWKGSDATAVVRALGRRRRSGASDGGDAGLPTAEGQQAVRRQDLSKVPSSLRVGRVAKKSMALEQAEPRQLLGSYDNVLSFNKVTGYSLNVPIANTCRPTAVCIKTCYFAAGAPSWANSLRHQRKVYDSLRDSPKKVAERVSLEYDRLGLTFLRWNGGGDLFPENVEAINHLGRLRPDIVLWVVTRIPEMAALIDHRPNVFIHFSLDKHSLQRRADFLACKPKSRNYFFSYQADADEIPPAEGLNEIAVLFFNNYQPSADLPKYSPGVVCPLNERADIEGVCEGCRRCFDGSAVRHGRPGRRH
jgi:hypothetical protein